MCVLRAPPAPHALVQRPSVSRSRWLATRHLGGAHPAPGRFASTLVSHVRPARGECVLVHAVPKDRVSRCLPLLCRNDF